MKRSLIFTVIGLGLLLLGTMSFLFLGAFGSMPILGIVVGLICITAAIIMVNKGDPTRLPQAHCWACGHTLDTSEKKNQ